MKAATSNEIKQHLKNLPQPRLVELCLRLARFKKENKELLTFLLFEAHDIDNYLYEIKLQVIENFSDINTSQLYFAAKKLRKILRTLQKYVRYTGSKTAEVELLLFFCNQVRQFNIPVGKSKALQHMYNMQIKKLNAAIAGLHQDLQHDYLKQLKALL